MLPHLVGSFHAGLPEGHDRFKGRILDMLEKAGVNYVVRTGIYDFYIGLKLNKLLGL